MAVAVPLSLSALLPLLLTTTTTAAIATSSVSWMEKVEGETVVLGCTWKGDPTGTEVLDVEWFLRMPTKTIYVATFVGGTEHVYAEFASRARFARNVTTQRDASLQIAGLRASDLGVYTCKVKFGSFIKLETTKLTVLVKPSPPSCVVDGSLQQGQELSLRCLSTEGTAHIRYKWSKAGVERPLQPVLRGTLRIRNVSVSHSGLYQCNASNDVGWGSCSVTLSVVTPSAHAGVVTGTVVGVLLVVVAAAVIGLLLKRKSVRNRDYHNDIL